MNIEHREDGDYIITEEKTSKNQTIIIKLDSELDNQVVSCIHGDKRTDITLIWKLRYSNEIGIYVKLSHTYLLKYDDEIIEIDNDTCINELTNMVKDNGTLEDCPSIQEAIYKSYNNLFYKLLKDNKILHSNFIVEGIVEVKSENKILGHGTRFILNGEDIVVCEYTGKSIVKSLLPQLNICIGNKKIIAETINYSFSREYAFQAEGDIGYLKYRILRDNVISITEEKVLNYPKLKVPYNYTDDESMVQFCKQKNTVDDIVKYKIALKGTTVILDINKYMVNEFLI